MVLNGNYKSLKSILFSLLLILGITLSSCDKKIPSIKGGVFYFNDKSYPISEVRYDHIGFSSNGDHIIRFIAYPGTYKYNTNNQTASGSGSALHIYLYANDKLLLDGNSYSIADITDSTSSTMITISENDTVFNYIDDAIISVDTAYDIATEKIFFKYNILAISGNDSITGQFIGTPITNIFFDQIAYGEISVDTIKAQLCKPTLWHWGKLFSDSYYHELTLYSTDARFNDNGKITSGIQFVIGISTLDSTLTPGIYPVSLSYDGNSTLYGHKLNNTPWGSYWQKIENQSAVGKANILSDTLIINGFTEKNITFSYKFTDQLKNTVSGSFNGPYYDKNL